MPDKKSEIDASMQRVLQKIQAEMPDVRKTKLSPFGMIDRLMVPKDAVATTSPITGNISYNPELMQSLGRDEQENTLAHELTHVRQRQNTPFLQLMMKQFLPQKSYSQRSDEMEAYQAERDRSLKNHLSVPDPVSGAVDLPLGPSAEMLKKMQSRGTRYGNTRND